MNYIRSYNSQKNLLGNDENNQMDEMQRRYQIMKLYTSRNQDSKQLIKNINQINQKQDNLSMRYATNSNTSFRNQLNSPNDKYTTMSTDNIYKSNSSNQANLLNHQAKIDQRNINNSSPKNKYLLSLPDNKNIFQLDNNNNNNNNDKLNNNIRGALSSNISQGGALNFNKKINAIASGSSNNNNQQNLEQFQNPKLFQTLYEKSMKSGNNQIDKNNSNQLCQLPQNYSQKIKKINLSNLNKDQFDQSNQMFKSQQKRQQQMTTNGFQSPKYENGSKQDSLLDMSSSHNSNSVNFYHQISPSSRSGNNYIKETLTTQESNYGSDHVINSDMYRTSELQKYYNQNQFKSNKINTIQSKDKQQFIQNDSKNKKTKQQIDEEAFQQQKKKFFNNIDKIMKKQDMIAKKNEDKNKKSQQIEIKDENDVNGLIKLKQSEVNLLLKKNIGKKLMDISPRSKMKIIDLINLKKNAKKFQKSAQNSFNSGQSSSEDENLSYDSDSVLTEELNDVEKYKKRLKATQVKFHKMHLKRMNKPIQTSQDQTEPNSMNNFLDLLLNEESPTKQKKMKTQIDGSQKPETYNVFGQYNDFSRQLQQKFMKTVHRLRPSRDILKYVEVESKKIQHKMTTMNAEKNNEMHKQSYKNLANTSIAAIQKMIPLFEEGLQQITDRNAVDEALSQIYQESLKTKNLVIQILCASSYAKISKLNKNYAKAIQLYKACKNCAEIPLLFNYRMNCYKNLGYCFSHLKMYDFAMFYYGKMLRVAWYQNNKDAELKAYDLIGKLEIAQYYHNKMLCADYEKEDSDMRRLGISKLDNALKRFEDGYGGNSNGANSNNPFSGGGQKKFRFKMENQDQDKSCDFEISSESEEDFELPIPSKSYQQQALKDNPNNESNGVQSIREEQEDMEQRKFLNDDDTDDSREIDRNNLLKLSMKQRKFKKNQPLFYHKDTYQLKQINDQANKNIHIGAVEKNKKLQMILPQKQINASSFKQIKGSTKIPYRINHLSVNRELDNYQCIDGRITRLKHFNFNEQMYDQYEKTIKQNVKTIFEDLRDNLIFSMSQLEMLVQKQKSPQKRKGGFSIAPQFGKQTNTQNNNLTLTSYQPQNYNIKISKENSKI